jgi:hypothetical protein
MAMKNEKPLTIDPIATRAKVNKDARTITTWSRLRGFPEGTVRRIFSGDYPFTAKLDTSYQRILRTLRDDGYLVEASTEGKAA